MFNKYLIQKSTLDGIAIQSNELIGKNIAVSTSDIINDLTEANSEVNSQSELITQIATVLEGKASVTLPTLSNPGEASDLMLGKELIDGEGKIVEGTFTIEEELNEQSDLITQIQNALDEKSNINLQNKSVIPNESIQTITADDGYDGLDTVTVSAMPTTTQATPSISVNSSGLITASATQTAGYVSSGTKSTTYQLAFQAAKTITPTTTSQIAVSSGYYTGGNITVAAIPSDYIIPSGTLTITENGTHNVKNYVSAVVEVEGGGSGEAAEWSEAEDAIVAGTLTEYSNDRVTKIGNGAFAYCDGLTSVNFPVCTSIGGYAFASCFSLTSVNSPACTSIGYGAFQSCSSLTSASFPECTYIGSNAFERCFSLASVNFPACTYIGGYAFYHCLNLTSVNFPVCTSIDRSNAFKYCSRLTSVNFPACTSIGYGAFQSCSNLTSVNFPVCTHINSYAFEDCFSLTSVNFPACTSIGYGAFQACSRLTSVNFPVCTSIDGNAFITCTSLTSISFPKCTHIGEMAFNYCTSLTTANFPVCTRIGYSGFRHCRTLSSLTLGASTVCTLSNSSAFYSTPYAGYSAYFSGTPVIYVPSSLLTRYQTATNWTYFSKYMVGY